MRLSTEASVDDVEDRHGRPEQEDTSALGKGLWKPFEILDWEKNLINIDDNTILQKKCINTYLNFVYQGLLSFYILWNFDKHQQQQNIMKNNNNETYLNCVVLIELILTVHMSSVPVHKAWQSPQKQREPALQQEGLQSFIVIF